MMKKMDLILNTIVIILLVLSGFRIQTLIKDNQAETLKNRQETFKNREVLLEIVEQLKHKRDKE